MVKAFLICVISTTLFYHFDALSAEPSISSTGNSRLLEISRKEKESSLKMVISLEPPASTIKKIEQLDQNQKKYLDSQIKRKFRDRWQMADNGAGRGGGGVVYCEPTLSSPMNGYYVLDFLLAAKELKNEPELNHDSQISFKLKETLPALAISYQLFLDAFIKEEDSGMQLGFDAQRNWVEKIRLDHYPDEELQSEDHNFISNLPSNCFKNGQLNIRQTVIRQRIPHAERPDQIFYEYDSIILKTLAKERPLQFSFMMVHEWLRDFVPSAQAIRKMNSFLHSREFLSLSAQQIKFRLIDLGLSTDEVVEAFLQIKPEFLKQLDEIIENVKLESAQSLKVACVMGHYFSWLEYLERKQYVLKRLCHDENLTESDRASNCAKALESTSAIVLYENTRATMGASLNSSYAQTLAPDCF